MTNFKSILRFFAPLAQHILETVFYFLFGIIGLLVFALTDSVGAGLMFFVFLCTVFHFIADYLLKAIRKLIKNRTQRGEKNG